MLKISYLALFSPCAASDHQGLLVENQQRYRDTRAERQRDRDRGEGVVEKRDEMGELLLCARGFDIRKQRQDRLVGVNARDHRKQRGKGDDLCGHLEALGTEHPQNTDQKRRKKRRGGDRENLALD